MRGDLLVCQRRAALARGRGILGNEEGYGVAGERHAPGAGEQGVGRPAPRLGQPGPQYGDGLTGERRDTFLAALAMAPDMRTRPELDVLAGEAGDL